MHPKYKFYVLRLVVSLSVLASFTLAPRDSIAQTAPATPTGSATQNFNSSRGTSTSFSTGTTTTFGISAQSSAAQGTVVKAEATLGIAPSSEIRNNNGGQNGSIASNLTSDVNLNNGSINLQGIQGSATIIPDPAKTNFIVTSTSDCSGGKCPASQGVTQGSGSANVNVQTQSSAAITNSAFVTQFFQQF